ncbi:MAG: hypothetical protein HWD61_03285 [Parachlamydiaceae bacterium]|nr:MAG: hypothetical protein HWD61_03285 [Parachlamydiaceae bacterium]
MQSNIPELAALLQRYIFQEYSSQSWLEVNRESYAYYRSYAASTHYSKNKVPQKQERGPEQVIQKNEVSIKKKKKHLFLSQYKVKQFRLPKRRKIYPSRSFWSNPLKMKFLIFQILKIFPSVFPNK